jgi:hypothetical protein
VAPLEIRLFGRAREECKTVASIPADSDSIGGARRHRIQESFKRRLVDMYTTFIFFVYATSQQGWTRREEYTQQGVFSKTFFILKGKVPAAKNINISIYDRLLGYFPQIKTVFLHGGQALPTFY